MVVSPVDCCVFHCTNSYTCSIRCLSSLFTKRVNWIKLIIIFHSFTAYNFAFKFKSYYQFLNKHLAEYFADTIEKKAIEGVKYECVVMASVCQWRSGWSHFRCTTTTWFIYHLTFICKQCVICSLGVDRFLAKFKHQYKKNQLAMFSGREETGTNRFVMQLCSEISNMLE